MYLFYVVIYIILLITFVFEVKLFLKLLRTFRWFHFNVTAGTTCNGRACW